MISPMALLMLLMMRKMYPRKGFNLIMVFSSTANFATSLAFLRRQALVDDAQYIKAMIPHHSSATMTNKSAALNDLELRTLSEQIIRSQERENTQMKGILERLKK